MMKVYLEKEVSKGERVMIYNDYVRKKRNEHTSAVQHWEAVALVGYFGGLSTLQARVTFRSDAHTHSLTHTHICLLVLLAYTDKHCLLMLMCLTLFVEFLSTCNAGNLVFHL